MNIFLLRFEVVKHDTNSVVLRSKHNNKVVLYFNPLKVEFYIGDYLVTSFNSRQLLKFEHLRQKE